MIRGRNDFCPCGSGKKYKRCCGSQAVMRSGGGGAPDIVSVLGLMESGLNEHAEKEARRILQHFPSHPSVLNVVAMLAGLRKDSQEALRLLRKAIGFAPQDSALWSNLGNALKDLGRLEEAENAYLEAVRLRPGFANAFYNLGLICSAQGRSGEAIRWYRQAVDAVPGYHKAWNNLGAVLQDEGQLDEAMGAYLEAIRLAPLEGMYYLSLAGVKKYGEDDRLLVEGIASHAEDFRQNPVHASGWHFGLGKIYDDLGQYQRAFEHYRQGNDFQKANVQFDRAAHERLISSLMSICNKDFFAARQRWGSHSEKPLLVVGMPRSGTTLVEQILASHQAVVGGGERAFWTRQGKVFGIERLAGLKASDVAKLSRSYLADLNTVSREALRVTDKMPGNFLHLGLLHAALPNARIIHCRRNPVDTCLSIYFQKFEGHHPYAYDLDDLAFYYRQYQCLMAHWREVLPAEVFLEVDYEALVEDQEGESRRLIEFCGLEWDAHCLEFHKTERVVKTASNWQVRQPIYKTSKERWRKYEQWIAPLLELLDEK